MSIKLRNEEIKRASRNLLKFVRSPRDVGIVPVRKEVCNSRDSGTKNELVPEIKLATVLAFIIWLTK